MAIDSIFFGSCLNIACHCDILRDSQYVDKKKFIEKHLGILKLAETLNKIYKPIVFMQLLTTNVLLCTIGFQVVVLRNIYGLILAAPFGVASVLQLFCYCYGGQLILSKTISVGDNCYGLNKESIIIVAKAQKGFKIESFLYQANLPTFTAILSSAQGLITMMKSFA